jgi:hypothetical protein
MQQEIGAIFGRSLAAAHKRQAEVYPEISAEGAI